MKTDYSAEILHIIEISKEEAQRLKLSEIYPECLLLGLLRDGGKAMDFF